MKLNGKCEGRKRKKEEEQPKKDGQERKNIGRKSGS